MTLEADPQILRLKRGRAWAETWAFANDDERADLTGCTGTFTVYAFTGATPIDAEVSIGSNGEVTYSLGEEQVAELAAVRAGHWELTITDSLGEVHDAAGPVWMEDVA
jgi:hypothetical protein